MFRETLKVFRTATCCGVLAWPCSSWAQEPLERAGDEFQNVTTLANIPAQRLGKVMNIMSEALGVNCTHCHAGHDFAKEDIPEKATARRMIEMTLALNRDHFAGRTVVTCMTCHQGQAVVPDATRSASLTIHTAAAAFDRPPVKAESEVSTHDPPSSPAPRAEPVDPRYRQWLGRATNQAAIDGRTNATREMRGLRLEPSGKNELEVIRISPPAAWEQVTHYDKLVVTERYAGDVIEKRAGERTLELKADEKANILIEARLALGLDLQSQFAEWSQLPDHESIDDRPMQVVMARSADVQHRFYFDRQSGLLTRRTLAVPTVIGAHVMQVDYREYLEVDGWPIASATSFCAPSLRWQRKLSKP